MPLILTAEYDLLKPEGALHAFFSVADGMVHSTKAHKDIAEFVKSTGPEGGGALLSRAYAES